IPEAVRKAFAVAEQEKPGATHLELPADVMEAPLDGDPVPRRPPTLVEPVAAELHRAAELLQSAERPVILAGNGIARQNAAPALTPAYNQMIRDALESHSDDGFPVKPQRVLRDLRALMRPNDLLISDVGAHKLWISRMWRAHEPNTVLISNGAAAMGFAVPA